MKARGYIYIASFSAFISFGCKKNYNPTAVSSGKNYLVVEGVINSGHDSTVIKLSRTVAVANATSRSPETGANISIESDNEQSYKLAETDSGRYVSAPLNIDNIHKYRLRITTTDGHMYLSDYSEVKVTPPIDTLGYTITGDGVNFWASAHDPANKTKYYRWDYTETYVYENSIDTSLIFDDSYSITSQKFRVRTPEQQIHTCYITQNSTSVIVNSTANLSQDVINNNPITQVPSISEKLYHKYSIVVRQYALTADAYNFWSKLKKNTEQIGGIFDAQPSEISGNIHCISNPSEPVIGFISVCSVTQKRIFIDNIQLPAWPIMTYGCTTQLMNWDEGAIPSAIVSGVWIPVGALTKRYDPAHKDTVFAIRVGEYDCVDCRYHLHGTNIKPGFWK